jgi:hypothetical protein
MNLVKIMRVSVIVSALGSGSSSGLSGKEGWPAVVIAFVGS